MWHPGKKEINSPPSLVSAPVCGLVHRSRRRDFDSPMSLFTQAAGSWPCCLQAGLNDSCFSQVAVGVESTPSFKASWRSDASVAVII